MVIIVAEEQARKAQGLLRKAGETVYRIGSIRPRKAGEPAVVVQPQS